MATVELMFGMLIISSVLVIFGWAIMLFAIQIGCVDTATQIARQAARGDHEAVQAARQRAPRAAKINIVERESAVDVTVRVRSQPVDWMPTITLKANAAASKEPGE